MAKLYTELKVGETIAVDNGRFNLTLESKKGRSARLRIESPNRLVIGKPERRQALTPPPIR